MEQGKILGGENMFLPPPTTIFGGDHGPLPPDYYAYISGKAKNGHMRYSWVARVLYIEVKYIQGIFAVSYSGGMVGTTPVWNNVYILAC